MDDYLQRYAVGLRDLQASQPEGSQGPKTLLGRGSKLQQFAASLKRLCKDH